MGVVLSTYYIIYELISEQEPQEDSTLLLLTWGRPLFFALMETLAGSAWAMRPYSSQCSLSSAQMYPAMRKVSVYKVSISK